MKIPFWLLHILPMWDYICPKCKRDVDKKSEKCIHCGEQYNEPLHVPPKLLKDPKALEIYVHKHVFPRVSRAQRDYLAQFFTELLNDGFESGDFSAWDGTQVSTGETATVEVIDPHHGTYQAKFSCDGSSANEYARVYKSLIAGQDTVYTRAYFKIITALPASGQGYRLIRHKSPETFAIGYVRIVNVAGTIKWLLIANEVEDEYIDSIQLDTWYCLELYTKVNTVSGEAKLYIDGTERCSLTGDYSLDTRISAIYIGQGGSTGATAHDIYVDCVVVADTYIGPEAAGGLSIPVAMHHYNRINKKIRG